MQKVLMVFSSSPSTSQFPLPSYSPNSCSSSLSKKKKPLKKGNQNKQKIKEDNNFAKNKAEPPQKGSLTFICVDQWLLVVRPELKCG